MHLDVLHVRRGARGIAKQIFPGAREPDTDIDCVQAFIELARQPAIAVAQGAE
jgi:LysR family transcriptional regulator, regulator for metE and metH